MATKAIIKTAQQLLEKFYREAEGKTNRQIDVYYLLEEMGVARDKSDPALDFLVTRGLLNSFGTDIAYLTELGAAVVIEEREISELPKVPRDFGKPSVENSDPAVPTTKAVAPRPRRAKLTYLDLEGQEFVLELGWSCSVGRAEGNDIQVPDQRASKRHAEIVYVDGHYVLRDQSSANGTLLNGQYVLEDSVLRHEDEIVIGRTMLLYQCPEVNVPPPGPKPSEEAPIAEAPLPPTRRPEPAPTFDLEAPEPAQAPPVASIPEAPAPIPEAPIKQPETKDDRRPGRRITESNRAAEPIKVVRGRPEAAPRRPAQAPKVEPRMNEPDLFAEPPTQAAIPPRAADLFGEAPEPATDLFGGPAAGDLFEPPTAQPARPGSKPAADLFGGPAGGDLFGDSSTTLDVPPSGDDLFGPAPMVTTQAQAPAPLDLQPLDLQPLDLQPLDLQEPETIAPQPTLAMPPLTPESLVFAPPPRQRAEIPTAPTVVPTASIPVAPAFVGQALPIPGTWPTEPPTDPATISKVDEGSELPDMSDDALELEPLAPSDAWNEPTPAEPPRLEEPPTLPPVADLVPEELPRWGEPLVAEASMATFDPESLRGEGENLPLAEPELPTLASPFLETLAALRDEIRRSEVYRREELMGALDLLERHPYVQAALRRLGR